MFSALKPLLILVACFYGLGSKSMDSYRPNPFNLPIKGFHNDVNSVFDMFKRTGEGIAFEANASSDPLEIAGRSMAIIGREIRTTNRVKAWM